MHVELYLNFHDTASALTKFYATAFAYQYDPNGNMKKTTAKAMSFESNALKFPYITSQNFDNSFNKHLSVNTFNCFRTSDSAMF